MSIIDKYGVLLVNAKDGKVGVASWNRKKRRAWYAQQSSAHKHRWAKNDKRLIF